MKLFKEGSIYSIGSFLNKFLLFLMIPLYAHYILPKDLSLLEILDPVEQFAYALLHLGLTQAFFRYFKRYSDDEDKKSTLISTVFWFLLIEAIFITGLFFIFAKPLTGFLVSAHPLALICFYLMVISLFFRLFNMLSSSYLQVRGKAGLLSFWTIFGTFTFCTINYIALVYFKAKIDVVFIARIFLLLPLALFGIGSAFHYIRLRFDRKLLMEMIHFSYPFILAAAAFPILNFFDRWMIDKMIGAADTGIYGMAYRFGMIPSMILVAPFLKAWQPSIYEKQKEDEREEYYQRILIYYTLIGCLLWLVLSAYSNELLTIFTSKAYVPGHVIIPYVAGSNFFYGLGWIIIAGLAIKGKTLYIGLSTMAAAFVNIILNYFMIPAYGMMGAAYATLLAFLFLFGSYSIYSYRKVPIRWPYGRILFMGAGSVFIYFITHIVYQPNIVLSILLKSFIVVPGAGFIAYLAGMTPGKIITVAKLMLNKKTEE